VADIAQGPALHVTGTRGWWRAPDQGLGPVNVPYARPHIDGLFNRWLLLDGRARPRWASVRSTGAPPAAVVYWKANNVIAFDGMTSGGGRDVIGILPCFLLCEWDANYK
jgi:hypothetical protein